jgi:hypothetical protein
MTAPVRRLLKLMKRDELKELCRRLYISPAGTSPELSNRLRSKLLRDEEGDEELGARKLLKASSISVEDWRDRLHEATGQKPGRSYDDLVDFVVQWAEGLLDDELEDDDEDYLFASDLGSAASPSPALGDATDLITSDYFGGIARHLAENSDIAERIRAVFQFTLRNPFSVWTLDLSKHPGRVSGGVTASPTCVVEMADADFRDLCTRRRSHPDGKTRGIPRRARVLTPA